MCKCQRMWQQVFKVFLAVLFISLPGIVHAETLTLTTFYPSPSGDYKDLYVTGSLGVGTTSPTTNLDVNGTFRLRPRSGAATSWAAGVAGQIAYSSTDNTTYQYNGTSWQALGGGLGTCTMRNSAASATFAQVACLVNEKVVTGGCQVANPAIHSTSYPYSSGGIQGWRCGEPTASTTLAAYANCCQ
ncbi:MAG: hypothetical protein V2A70_07420 [Candidatus Omnitrophota bacterium]